MSRISRFLVVIALICVSAGNLQAQDVDPWEQMTAAFDDVQEKLETLRVIQEEAENADHEQELKKRFLPDWAWRQVGQFQLKDFPKLHIFISTGFTADERVVFAWITQGDFTYVGREYHGIREGLTVPGIADLQQVQIKVKEQAGWSEEPFATIPWWVPVLIVAALFGVFLFFQYRNIKKRQREKELQEAHEEAELKKTLAEHHKKLRQKRGRTRRRATDGADTSSTSRTSRTSRKPKD